MSTREIVSCLGGDQPARINWLDRRFSSETRHLKRSQYIQVLNAVLDKVIKRDYRYLEEIPAAGFFSGFHAISIILDGVKVDLTVGSWQVNIFWENKWTQTGSDVPKFLMFMCPIKRAIYQTWKKIEEQQKRCLLPGTGVKSDAEFLKDARISPE